MMKAMKAADADVGGIPAREPVQVSTIDPNTQRPIGTLPLARLREDFRETAAWLPHLRTAADGKVQAQFKLPDSLTRYRLTAVAITRDSEFGVGRTTYNDSPSDLKHYCMARNNLVNLRDYRGPLHAAAFVVKTAWFYTFTRPSLARLRLSVRAMRAGIAGDFDGHRRYLS